MGNRVFFSFHYQDVVDFRANVVRNHWVAKPNREAAGFYDASLWEETKRRGNASLKSLINIGLNNTSNTCVLIGSSTYARPWVRYELLKSFKRGNHIFGVHINGIKGKDANTKNLGPNPLEHVGVTYSDDGRTATLWELTGGVWTEYSEIDGSASYGTTAGPELRGKGFNLSNLYPTYRWNADDGYENFSTWVS